MDNLVLFRRKPSYQIVHWFPSFQINIRSIAIYFHIVLCLIYYDASEGSLSTAEIQ